MIESPCNLGGGWSDSTVQSVIYINDSGTVDTQSVLTKPPRTAVNVGVHCVQCHWDFLKPCFGEKEQNLLDQTIVHKLLKLV